MSKSKSLEDRVVAVLLDFWKDYMDIDGNQHSIAIARDEDNALAKATNTLIDLFKTELLRVIGEDEPMLVIHDHPVASIARESNYLATERNKLRKEQRKQITSNIDKVVK